MRVAVAILTTTLLVLLIPAALLTQHLESRTLSPKPLLHALDQSGVYEEIVPVAVNEIIGSQEDTTLFGDLTIRTDRISQGFTVVFPPEYLKSTVETLVTESFQLTKPGMDLVDLNLTISLAEAKQRLRDETGLILEEIGAKQPPALPDCTDGQLLSIALDAESLKGEDASFSLFQKEGCWPSTLIGSVEGSFLLDGIPIHPDLVASQLPTEINLTRFLIPKAGTSANPLGIGGSAGPLSEAEILQLRDIEERIDQFQESRALLNKAQAILWIVIGIILLILTAVTMTSFARTLWWYGLLLSLLGIIHLGIGLLTRFVAPTALQAQLERGVEVPSELQMVLLDAFTALLNGISTPLIAGGFIGLIIGMGLTFWSHAQHAKNTQKTKN